MTASAIDVQGVSKRYKVYRKPADIVLELFTRRPRHQEFWALRDVSFSVRPGEMVGIIGKNGSGKSTLLKIIAGTLDKTLGQIAVQGKVSAILELGTGFHPERTGRENVILGGMCMGMSKKEVEGKLDEIVAFSGVGEFIDRPFRIYSSGMKARLTFATATAIKPEILIVDEALATGDRFFVQKCLRRVRQICSSGCTTLFVSHDIGTLSSLCSRVIWLDHGQVRRDGPALEVLREYHLSVHEDSSDGEAKLENVLVKDNEVTFINEEQLQNVRKDADSERSMIYKRGPIEITRVELLDGTGKKSAQFRPGEPLTIRVGYKCNGEPPSETLGMAVAINQADTLLCACQFNTNCYTDDEDALAYSEASYRRRPATEGFIEARIGELQLKPGPYCLSLGLLPNLHDQWHFYEYHHFLYRFQVGVNGWSFGGVFLPLVDWSHSAPARKSAAA